MKFHCCPAVPAQEAAQGLTRGRVVHPSPVPSDTVRASRGCAALRERQQLLQLTVDISGLALPCSVSTQDQVALGEKIQVLFFFSKSSDLACLHCE